MYCKTIRGLIDKIAHEVAKQTAELEAIISVDSPARSLIYAEQLGVEDKSNID